MIAQGTRILSMDSTWTPERWLTIEDATALLTRGLVHYSLGDSPIVLRGGVNAKTGLQSLLEVKSILVTNTRGRTLPRDWAPPVTRELMIHRDRHLCGFCGGRFSAKHLTMDHIVPRSKGGSDYWTNVITACRLYPYKSLLVHDVSEWTPGKAAKRILIRTRNRYQLVLRVRKEVQ